MFHQKLLPLKPVTNNSDKKYNKNNKNPVKIVSNCLLFLNYTSGPFNLYVIFTLVGK